MSFIERSGVRTSLFYSRKNNISNALKYLTDFKGTKPMTCTFLSRCSLWIYNMKYVWQCKRCIFSSVIRRPKQGHSLCWSGEGLSAVWQTDTWRSRASDWISVCDTSRVVSDGQLKDTPHWGSYTVYGKTRPAVLLSICANIENRWKN